MKKLFLLLFIIGGITLTGCQVMNDNNEIYNDLDDFRNGINYVAFDYDEENELFSYKLNNSLFTVKLSEITKNNEVIDLHYIAYYGDKTKNGHVYKNIISDNSGLLISFDDYYKTWDDVVLLFDENDIKATWYVKGGKTTDFEITANSLGQCIGYHTKNHTLLTNLSEKKFDNFIDKFDWECIHFLNEYRAVGIPMKTFAIPHGNKLILDYQIDRLYSKGKFQIIRDFDPLFHLYTENEIKSGYISSQSIDNNKFIDDEDFSEKMNKRLLITKLTQKIYPCTSHTFSDDVNANNGYSMTYKRLNLLFDLIKSYKLKTYTFDEFCK